MPFFRDHVVSQVVSGFDMLVVRDFTGGSAGEILCWLPVDDIQCEGGRHRVVCVPTRGLHGHVIFGMAFERLCEDGLRIQVYLEVGSCTSGL